MKKTLIALAALAASGASFAEVTISGSYAFGYKTTTIASYTASAGNNLGNGVINSLAGGNDGITTTGDAAGFGVDTSTVTFADSEDLGGGYTAATSINIDTIARSGVSGGDTSLTLTTPVGRLTLQQYKPADYIQGNFGVGGVGMDNKVFGKRDVKEGVAFLTKVGPIYVSLEHLEADTVAGSTTNILGLGTGAQGDANTIGQRLNSYSFTYKTDALLANVNYLSYDNVGTTFATRKNVIRAGGTYDFGSFKVGGGVETLTLGDNGKYNAYGASVAVPFGQLTLGANYASTSTRDLNVTAYSAGLASLIGANGLDINRNGYGLSAAYALSKRTSLSMTYVNWSNGYLASNGRNAETAVLLAHSF